MPGDGIDLKIVERIRDLIVRNPFIGVTDLKRRAGNLSRERLDLHLGELGANPDYGVDLQTWKRNVDFKPPRRPLGRKKAEGDTSPTMKRVPHMK